MMQKYLSTILHSKWTLLKACCFFLISLCSIINLTHAFKSPFLDIEITISSIFSWTFHFYWCLFFVNLSSLYNPRGKRIARQHLVNMKQSGSLRLPLTIYGLDSVKNSKKMEEKVNFQRDTKFVKIYYI